MAFTYKLEHEDGTLADPPVFGTAVPTWSVGDTIPLGLGGFAWLPCGTTTPTSRQRLL
jgi:hypothetical protein